jgi:hypothetical protein
MASPISFGTLPPTPVRRSSYERRRGHHSRFHRTGVSKGNGRPKILPPEAEPGFQARSQDSHILRAVGRAWAWRRRLENGEVATIQDIATMEKVSDRFVSRIIRLAYLSPEVLERLVIWRVAPSVTVNELAKVASLPWVAQMGRVFAQI